MKYEDMKKRIKEIEKLQGELTALEIFKNLFEKKYQINLNLMNYNYKNANEEYCENYININTLISTYQLYKIIDMRIDHIKYKIEELEK